MHVVYGEFIVYTSSEGNNHVIVRRANTNR